MKCLSLIFALLSFLFLLPTLVFDGYSRGIDVSFWEFAVVAVVAIAAVMGLRIMSQTGSKSSYRDALKVKDGVIDDLRGEVRRWRGKANMAVAPPYGAENIDDITSKLPKWARPFVGPMVEWAQTDEGKQVIEGLIKKYAKAPSEAAPEGV